MGIHKEAVGFAQSGLWKAAEQEKGLSRGFFLNPDWVYRIYEAEDPSFDEMQSWQVEYDRAPDWLPEDGQRSFNWFEQVFNWDNEFDHILQLTQADGQNVGRAMLLSNLVGFMTEWGSGKEALTVQPGVDYSIRKKRNGKYEVIAHNVREFGDQLPRYLEYEKLPGAIGKGLGRMFESLYDKSPGEGGVILSPQELYEDYDSPGDVINPMVVTGVDKNDQREKVVHARGWFLFTNRRLSDPERRLMLELHQDQGDWGEGKDGVWGGAVCKTDEGISAEALVEKPVNLSLPMAARRKRSEVVDEPAMLYVDYLNELFYEKFGRLLFSGNQESGARSRARRLVGWKLNELYENLMEGGSKENFYLTLSKLIVIGQGEWAQAVGIDRSQYVGDLVDGRLQIVGFHPTSGEDMTQYWDSNSQSWIGGEGCGESGKTCDSCGKKYEGESCPSCG